MREHVHLGVHLRVQSILIPIARAWVLAVMYLLAILTLSFFGVDVFSLFVRIFFRRHHTIRACAWTRCANAYKKECNITKKKMQRSLEK